MFLLQRPQDVSLSTLLQMPRSEAETNVKPKQVLDYFDAFLIGLTATPDNRTYGFFKNNEVLAA